MELGRACLQRQWKNEVPQLECGAVHLRGSVASKGPPARPPACLPPPPPSPPSHLHFYLFNYLFGLPLRLKINFGRKAAFHNKSFEQSMRCQNTSCNPEPLCLTGEEGLADGPTSALWGLLCAMGAPRPVSSRAPVDGKWRWVSIVFFQEVIWSYFS